MKCFKQLLLVFLIWTLVGSVSKVPFLIIYHNLLSDAGVSDICGIFYHGLRLDLAIAGYLSVIPGVLLIVSLWVKRRKVLRGIWNSYFYIIAAVISLGFISNIALYGFWGFPLDATPLLYLRTSPGDAFASATPMMILAALIAEAVMTWGIGMTFTKAVKLPEAPQKQSIPLRLACSLGMLLLTAALFIPIRGGFSTGTNHTGNVYFSSNQRVNHAAVNPIFCFIESVLHFENLTDRYRFMDDEEAARIFADLTKVELGRHYGGITKEKRPVNVVLIMLESFSKYIMEEGGNVSGVTPNLDSFIKEGYYFSNFYASSFRTDRAIVSILSGLPAQPTMSIMDMPKKTNGLCSLAGTLGRHGYSTSFYYGGDVGYSNMKSYVMGTGYENVVSETEFPSEKRQGKWGVHDGDVFDRILKDISEDESSGPFFRTMMTLSSHEPFDVPYHSSFSDEALNAFSYTDKCLGHFVGELKNMPCWENTLVVMVPDHLGAYPPDIDNFQLWRYQIPFIIIGGAIEGPKKFDTLGCQTDIPATLLSMLGFEHDDFSFSRDMLDPDAPHFAFFDFPDAFGFVEGEEHVFYDITSGTVASGNAEDADRLVAKGKAYLQTLYKKISEL